MFRSQRQRLWNDAIQYNGAHPIREESQVNLGSACAVGAAKKVDLLIAQGGTRGTVQGVEQALAKKTENGMLYYWPAMRTLLRLGLAYIVDSANAPYFIAAKGVVDAFRRQHS